jgi:Uma2 family endonuclease
MPTLVANHRGHPTYLWKAEDFLEWLEPGLFADLIDGEKFMHSPVSLKHARLLNFLDEYLRRWLRRSGMGGELFREVVAVRLSQRNVFLTDLCWFAPEQLADLEPTHAPIPPRWVCEVLSPATADRDIGPKFAAYEERGVAEYWVLDPDYLEHRFFTREGDYLTEFGADSDIVVSRTFPGLTMRRSWLDADQLPDADECLR